MKTNKIEILFTLATILLLYLIVELSINWQENTLIILLCLIYIWLFVVIIINLD